MKPEDPCPQCGGDRNYRVCLRCEEQWPCASAERRPKGQQVAFGCYPDTCPVCAYANTLTTHASAAGRRSALREVHEFLDSTMNALAEQDDA